MDFEIHTFPIIEDMVAVNEAFQNNWKLLQGYSSETSGGLLVSLPAANAQVRRSGITVAIPLLHLEIYI